MADEKLVKVKILRAYWDENAKRIDEGTEIEIPISAALEGVEAGVLATVKAAAPEKKEPAKK